MNEKEFWDFLEGLQKKGRVEMISGSIDTGSGSMGAAGAYMTGHALLPAEHDNLSRETINGMGELLFIRNVDTKTKEAVLILLAHQPTKDALNVLEKYNRAPDRELMFFAKMALDECVMWNE